MSWLDKTLAASLPLVPRPVMRRFSRRYIAGESRQAALSKGGQLQRSQYRVTYDLLGEAVSDKADVEIAVTEYECLLEELVKQGLERNVSVKPTQMGLLMDEDYAYDIMVRLAEQAVQQQAFIRYEMEDAPTIPGTLRVFARLRQRFSENLGCVLQSRVFRAEQDARDLVRENLPLNVRLVKGIYLEPPEIAYQEMADINAAYTRILRILLEGGAFVGVATHDEKLVAHLKKLYQENPAYRERSEIQMLLGVREEHRRQWKLEGLPVRVYVPYGEHWLPYVKRRLRKNPQLLRHSLKGIFARTEPLD